MLAGAPAAFADALTDQANALLEQGKAADAFALLSPLEGDRAGSLEYDLLLGIAAVDSGQNTRAIFALERVLAVDPNNSRARAEIARAYLAVGETETSRKEFQTVRGQAVPPAVKSAIDRYLTALDQVEAANRFSVRRYIEFGVGHDSNANAGPAVDQYQGFTIPGAQRNQADNYGTFGGGIDFRAPVGGGLAIIGSLSASGRANMRWDQFDTSSIDGSIGVAHQQAKDTISASLQASTFKLAIDPANNGIGRTTDRYRDSAGFSLQWQHNYDQRTQTSAFVQYGELKYPGQTFRDARRWMSGAGFAKALRESPVLFFGGIYFGAEHPVTSARDDLGFGMAGMRLGGQYTLNEDMAMFANLGYEHRQHSMDDLVALMTRRDKQLTFGVGLAWVPAKDWRVTPQAQVVRNDSTIAINEFHRRVYSVTVRRDF